MTTIAGATVTADIWFRCYGVGPAEVISQLKGREMMVDRFAELPGITQS